LTRNTQAKPGLDADESLDRLIEKRSRDTEAQERIEKAWAEASLARTYNLRAQTERRREWINYHNDLARLHSRLAEEHRQEIGRLLDGGGGR
jgi:hypothetical protein